MRKITLAAVTAMTSLFGAAVQADPLIDATQTHCITPLHTDVALGFGLERAAPEMEAKLLNSKQAKVYRTDNPQLLVVAHDSGITCEIMALGPDLASFGAATGEWHIDGVALVASDDSDIHVEKPSGGYYAQAREGGGFIQIFVTSKPDNRFVGITVGRVEDSAHARKILGL